MTPLKATDQLSQTVANLLAGILAITALALTAILIIISQPPTSHLNPNQLVLKNGPGMQYKSVNLTKTVAANAGAKKHGWQAFKLNSGKTVWVNEWNLAHPQTKKHALTGTTIVLDPGHGGNDSGALYRKNLTKKQYEEKTYTLKFAQQLATKLRAQGAHVIMTRNNDVYKSLGERTRLSNRVQADAFVSFHFDSAPQDNLASGFTTYYYHKNQATKKLAKTVSANLTGLPLTNRGIDFADYYVLHRNHRPAILLEMGYINTTKDFRQIQNPTYQQKVVDDVERGLIQYFKD
ncbi:N-acetylmuramoyl-L-alanine amidase [Limosilactobacillus equigenerosi DSM 18793 = JCM 14505]|uniref:N-acetylmuramoyl-L-alanine amidase n=1 Tax=Limosilactobacillus equigenerosi DSM 18793 = JCM 14505 TaxID=1423742 RepID=A0A0R1UFT5_9LACO|nr:N-acetylmuramoyl-L-alanine amidase [Limosilactobacillus equigenerosi DSM 18793 = JCM 14505]